ncbi:F0F1 ATP synthase subunit delta [Siminovitchia sp. FSL W7-1587]|uniref:F0F1 ATP synthase subunit delta n=1 Tax=Siminovitchia sp. FSL W7-1587 TaxID=2954699 RepID=UPI0030CBF7CE
MSNPVVAQRYALALFQLAKEQNMSDQIVEELRTVKKVLVQNPGFIHLLQSPKLSVNKKRNLIKEVFQNASQSVINTMMLLTDRHRENIILEVAEIFIKLLNEERGIAETVVYSVRPLTAEETKAISETFAPKVGKTALNIENIIDSELLGGVKVRIGNRVFDGSLKGKLDRLERTLVS